MSIDESSREGEGEPTRQRGAESPVGSTSDQYPPTAPTFAVREKDQPKTTEVVNEVRLAEHWLIGIGLASVLVSAILGYIYYQQLREMREATQASKQAVDVATYTLITSSSQFDRSMSQTITQTQQAIRAANVAKRAADIASDTLRKSQRPWVTAESFMPSTFVTPPEGKFGVDGDLIIKNTGASVATNGWVMMEAVPNGGNNSNHDIAHDWDKACRDVDQQISANKKTPWPIGFVLGPNQETRMRMGASDPSGIIDAQISRPAPYSPFPKQDARSGQFYLLGCARYKDQFGAKHTTRFCFIYLNDKTSPNGFYVCNGMETAD